DSEGNVMRSKSYTDRTGQTERQAYREDGTLLRKSIEDEKGRPIRTEEYRTDGQTKTKTITYAEGQPVEVFDGKTGETTRYDYDGPDGQWSKTQTWDSQNKLTHVESFVEDGGMRTYTVENYDGEGNKTFKSELITDAREAKRYEYGPDGKILRKSIEDAKGRPIETYDGKTGETTRYLYDGPNGELSGTLALDSQHRVVRAYAADTGVTTHSIFDTEGRIIENRNVSRDGSLLGTEEYTYGADGKISEMTTKDGDGKIINTNSQDGGRPGNEGSSDDPDDDLPSVFRF